MPHTSSTYKIWTSRAWEGYPTYVTECPNFEYLSVTSLANIDNGAYLLIDDEIFHVIGIASTSGVACVCSRMLTYAHVCSRMLTLADVC